ncbi:D-galactonate transporter [Aquitalea magnusonii]|uniref:D-galactonate transporter n=1 Tax=Aquitalea magnusonii TaxID=332411 RepID=A0A3G9GEI2_9NEIS|nr:MFS transporter [Aquitalea magnusonii]BBF84661.1 D-galactonate transporter [Aquitalea magnusonii]
MTTLNKSHRGTQRRWRIGGLLGIGVLVNYFDRISLSVAAPQLQQEFHLSSSDLGLLFSAFFWTYALLQIPTGLILDRFGVTRVGRWGALLWGVASTLTACAGGFGGIFAARALLGVAEAPGFPVSAKATGYWFPRRERAMATAIFDAAAKFSNVIGVPLVALTVVHLGWRWGFGLTALLSVAYFIAFSLIYRDPSQDRKLSDREYQYIVQGGAAAEGVGQAGSLAMLGYLLQQRKVWGLSIGFAAYGYVFYLFLTWLPGYLVQSMHMSILKSASYAAIPWVFATLSDLLVGGWLIDHLIARGHDETRVRKGVLLGGMLLGLAVFGATTTSDPVIAIIWITIALSGLAAAAPVGWSLPSLIAPRGGTGTVGGIMNFANNMMGAVAPIVTGYIVGSTHSFTNAFLVAGGMLIIGVFAFVFLLGRIEAIAEPPVTSDSLAGQQG